MYAIRSYYEASGDEAVMIGELWEAVYAMADDTLLEQLQD